ncbi:MAG TPA: TrkH family potassium uptake protein [Aliiroseovarius sp.]|nr:TrkH family potassium uptake protein [Aliiroseovarius sp.]
MRAALEKLPLSVILMLVSSLLMLVPASHALVAGEYAVSRSFFYSGLELSFLAGFLAIARSGRTAGDDPRRTLLALSASFVALPLALALPFHEAVGNTTWINAYVEMVSSLTTTGASMFEDPARLPASVHLWRALVGWFGGLIMWVAAVAVLAPLAMGGFEVRADAGEDARAGITAGNAIGSGRAQDIRSASLSQRLAAFSMKLAPLYAGLTLVLWVGLIVAGDTPFVAANHAMSTLATSGISPVGGLSGGSAGTAGEVMIAVFLVFAVSRLAFDRQGQRGTLHRLLADPEMRLGAAIVVGVTAVLFLRHWIGAYGVAAEANLLAGLRALWGMAFTVLSFLTTTGFESAAWAGARDWSALDTQGLVLMALALIGGGVATTAGGAKLLRVYAMYKHSSRELQKLLLPSSIAGAGREARHIRSRGAFRAWIFFMLTALAVALYMLAFALTGLDFPTALVLTTAALTTTGPLAAWVTPDPVIYETLANGPKLILASAMIVGRLEILAIVVLVSPEIWRR